MSDAHRVFDAHLHVQPWHMIRPEVQRVLERNPAIPDVLRVQQDADVLDAWLDEQGVARAVLVNYVAPEVTGFPPEVNEWVADLCRGHDRLIPMGSVHPRLVKDAGAEVERLVDDLGIRALKVHPAHQLFAPNAYATGELPALADVYATAERLGVPVTVHTGTSTFPRARNRFAEPLLVDDVAVDYPDLTILLAHCGRPFWMEQAVFLARRHPNVHLELSGIPPAKLLEYLPRLPDLADKAVFGTDWPGPGVRSVRENVRAFLDLPLTADAKRRILWENAARIFG